MHLIHYTINWHLHHIGAAPCQVPLSISTTGHVSARPFSPSKLPLCVWGSGPPSNTWFLGPTRVHIPHGISISPAIFLRAHNRDQQTILLHRLHLASAAMHTPQPFYGPFSGTTRVSRCQKRTSGLYNNTNTNTNDNVYGAVIMARPLREFTRFI